MRQLTLLGLAVAVVALTGAAPASATRLCTSNTTPCANVLAAGSAVTLNLEPGTSLEITLASGGFHATMTCTTSQAILTATSAGGGAGVAVTGRLTSLSISSCTHATSTASCTSSVTVGSLASANAAITSTSGMNGTLQVTTPLIGISCIYQLGVFTQCTYGGSGTLDGTVTGGNPSDVRLDIINQTVGPGGAFNCGVTTRWNATYTTSGPLAVTAS